MKKSVKLAEAFSAKVKGLREGTRHDVSYDTKTDYTDPKNFLKALDRALLTMADTLIDTIGTTQEAINVHSITLPTSFSAMTHPKPFSSLRNVSNVLVVRPDRRPGLYKGLSKEAFARRSAAQKNPENLPLFCTYNEIRALSGMESLIAMAQTANVYLDVHFKKSTQQGKLDTVQVLIDLNRKFDANALPASDSRKNSINRLLPEGRAYKNFPEWHYPETDFNNILPKPKSVKDLSYT